MPLIELYGYAGSLLIAVSLMLSNLKWLRWLNMIGAGIFSTYGLIIGAWPVAILNGFIVLINAVHLVQHYRKEKNAYSTEFQSNNPYVQQVLTMKWPQLRDLPSHATLNVTFMGSEPTDVSVVS